jgi:hypothetical protein
VDGIVERADRSIQIGQVLALLPVPLAQPGDAPMALGPRKHGVHRVTARVRQLGLIKRTLRDRNGANCALDIVVRFAVGRGVGQLTASTETSAR